MIKNIIILFGLLISANYHSQKKNTFDEGEIVYIVSFGGKDTKSVGKKIADSLRVKQSIMDRVMNLMFSGKTARLVIKFKENKVLSIPEIKPEAKTKEDFNLTQSILEKKGVYYTDLSKNIVYNDKDFRGKNIIVGYKISDLKWNITNEVIKTPKGNTLRKATTKYKFEKEKGKQIIREVTAWFTEDIPIKVAPMQFHGLPGLVAKIDIEGISFNLSSINSKKVNVDYKIDPSKVITEDEYMDFIDKAFN